MTRAAFVTLDATPVRRRGGRFLLALLAGLLLTLAPLSAAPAKAKAKESCFDCHSDKDMTKEGPNGTPVSLFVDSERFGKAVHASLACRDCHAAMDKDHPGGNPPLKVNCGNCHTKATSV